MSKKKKKITDDLLAKINPNAVVAQGFDEAYVGYLRRANKPSIALYDYKTCIDILIRDEDYTLDEAIDFMENYILQHDEGDSTCGFAHWKDEYDNGKD